MSSGFVSGGTIDKPIERDDEWLKAEQELEEIRKRKDELARKNDGKSLYEVLQQNKAAKQEAFEESIRLKNQFRSLDQDEIEFLDSVLESTRAREEAVKKETAEQLDLFRRQQEKADQALAAEPEAPPAPETAGGDGSPPGQASEWTVPAKKRKRGKDNEKLKGLKLRKSSSSSSKTPMAGSEKNAVQFGVDTPTKSSPPAPAAPASRNVDKTLVDSTAGSLGLGDYDSDD